MVNATTWQITKYRGNPLPRKPHDPPPCQVCPKCENETEKSPAVGRKSELSEKNLKTLDLYWQTIAAGGDRNHLDDLAKRNIGVIHELIERFKIEGQRSLTRWLAIISSKA